MYKQLYEKKYKECLLITEAEHKHADNSHHQERLQIRINRRVFVYLWPESRQISQKEKYNLQIQYKAFIFAKI